MGGGMNVASALNNNNNTNNNNLNNNTQINNLGNGMSQYSNTTASTGSLNHEKNKTMSNFNSLGGAQQQHVGSVNNSITHQHPATAGAPLVSTNSFYNSGNLNNNNNIITGTNNSSNGNLNYNSNNMIINNGNSLVNPKYNYTKSLINVHN